MSLPPSSAERELAQMRAQLESIRRNSAVSSKLLNNSNSSITSPLKKQQQSSSSSTTTQHQQQSAEQITITFEEGDSVILTDSPQELKAATSQFAPTQTKSLASKLAYLGCSGTFLGQAVVPSERHGKCAPEGDEGKPINGMCVVEFADGSTLEVPFVCLRKEDDVNDNNNGGGGDGNRENGLRGSAPRECSR